MIIYRAYDKNGKSYIGCCKDLTNRKRTHKYQSIKMKRPHKFNKAIRKYGFDSFVFEIIEICDETIAFDREIYWIEKYNSFKNGYNSSLGGRGSNGMKNTKKEVKRKSLQMKSFHKNRSEIIAKARTNSLTTEKQKARSKKFHELRWSKMPEWIAIDKKTGKNLGPYRGYYIAKKILDLHDTTIIRCLIHGHNNRKYIMKYTGDTCGK